MADEPVAGAMIDEDIPPEGAAAGWDAYRLSRILAFRQLATRFLNVVNPAPDTFPVILDCITSYDGPLPPTRLRHFAHMFESVVRMVTEGGAPESAAMRRFRGDRSGEAARARATIRWIYEWIRVDGVHIPWQEDDAPTSGEES